MTERRDPRERWAWAMLALALAYQAAMSVTVYGRQVGVVRAMDRLHPDCIRKDTYGEDTYCLYQAGHSLLQGHSMYKLQGAPVVVPRTVPYGYHPVMGVVWAGVSLVFSPEGAHRANMAFTQLTLLACALALGRMLRLVRAERIFLVAGFLLYTPLHPELYVGQVNSILVIFLTGIVGFERAGRHGVAGSLWAISMVLKPSLVVLGALWARLFRWRRLVLGLAFVLATGVPYYLSHPGSWETSSNIFSHGMARTTAGSQGFYAFVLDLALRSGLAKFTAIHVARNLVLAMAGVAVLILFMDREVDETWWVCVLTITYGLGAHMFWEYSYVVMLPVLGILLFGYRDWRAAVVWVFLALPTPFAMLREWDLHYVRPYGAAASGFRFDVLLAGMFQHGIKAVPLAIYWGLLLAGRRRHLGRPWPF